VEETWELAVIEMASLNLTSLGFVFAAFALLSACSQTTADVDDLSIEASSTTSSPTQQGGSFSFMPSLSISVSSEPWMIVRGVNYPMIYLSCGDKKSSFNAWLRYRPWVTELGELDMRATPLSFWDYNPVFFDEVETSFPAGYGTKTKQVHIGDGKYVTRSERVGTDPKQTINKILIPNLKTAKTMRIGEQIVFDLGGVKEKIEQLESQCNRLGSSK